jgi:hypothetical protein
MADPNYPRQEVQSPEENLDIDLTAIRQLENAVEEKSRLHVSQ